MDPDACLKRTLSERVADFQLVRDKTSQGPVKMLPSPPIEEQPIKAI